MSTTTASPQPGRSAAATHPLDALGAALADNWWLIALRGVLLGIIALIMPVATILTLVLLFSAYSVA
jgi:uncharacterized membrane protein HdeD (DUF308 family)